MAPRRSRAGRSSGKEFRSSSASAAGFDVVHGRFLSDEEIARGASAVVVSNRLARELAAGANASTVVGTTLMLQDTSWTIVGVLEASPIERTFGAVVPFAAASQAMMPAPTPRVPRILVSAPRVEDVSAVRSQVESWADATDRRWRADSQVSISATGLARLQQARSGDPGVQDPDGGVHCHLTRRGRHRHHVGRS